MKVEMTVCTSAPETSNKQGLFDRRHFGLPIGEPSFAYDGWSWRAGGHSEELAGKIGRAAPKAHLLILHHASFSASLDQQPGCGRMLLGCRPKRSLYLRTNGSHKSAVGMLTTSPKIARSSLLLTRGPTSAHTWPSVWTTFSPIAPPSPLVSP
jgi:hypothetical protein